MDGVRAKLTPSLKPDGTLHVLVEWVEVTDSVPGEVKFSEEFQMVPGAGGSYVSRVCVSEATVLPGTFWLDKDGRRHFRLDAEVAEVGAVGGVIDTIHTQSASTGE